MHLVMSPVIDGALQSAISRAPSPYTSDDIVTVTDRPEGAYVRLVYRNGSVTTHADESAAPLSLNQDHRLLRATETIWERFADACETDAPGQNVHLIGVVDRAGAFYAEDVYIGGFLDEREKDIACIAFGVERVEVLFEGFWDDDLMAHFAGGRTAIAYLTEADDLRPRAVYLSAEAAG
ncbi:hypothetical protein KIKIMORA_02970 [Brevundimonas phage vB_BpoS-Kikimora]|uniref:Uncharacterized protein n=1 Tax=Brevundimonas phage vB_BpoS-Kikimora TaxID=2948601 RepID=A0A9E7SKE7_9CAUD|nr:hypothetical protein KIKIMORA_02970 [Brevundimonas phage vB_BpoS-Kikimora]